MDARQCLLLKRLNQLEERIKGLDINTELYSLLKEERDKVVIALEEYDNETLDEVFDFNDINNNTYDDYDNFEF